MATPKGTTLARPLRILALLAFSVGLLSAWGLCQQPVQNVLPNRLAVTTVDDNGVAVVGANMLLVTDSYSLRCETDFAGRCTFRGLHPGKYSLQVEKLGFYRFEISNISFPETNSFEVRLAHEQEVRETVDVVESQPAIDPERTAPTETLSQREILNVPYPTSRDIRNALPLLPQVVMDKSGDIHIAGSSRIKTLNLLDGFDVSAPAGGFMDMRVNSDSVRTVEVDSSRYTAQYGRGDNVLGINTGIGDDQFRYSATNFLPSFQTRKGLHFDQWAPRATISGPIQRGKIWFYLAPEVEYNQNIVEELPAGEDRATQWRTGNLAKLQVNFTSANIFSSEFVVNNFHAPNSGLSAFTPFPTTINQRSAAYMGAVKDQHYFKSGALFEAGFAVSDSTASQRPLGSVPYEVTPELARGSYYASTRGGARRFQGITNLYLAPKRWHGRHDLKMGGDVNRLSYRRSFQRDPIYVLREDGSLARDIQFTGDARTEVTNVQTSVYLQDRWTPRERLLIESGIRMDWDQIVRETALGPRIAATYMLDQDGNTKLSAGFGLFYLATNLEILSRPLTGRRFDRFFAADGSTLQHSPALTEFSANWSTLKQPRTFSWSLGLEQKLPHAVYARLDFLQKRAEDNFLYVNTAGPGSLVGNYVLTNGRSDHYDAATLTLRHTFANVYPVMVAYTRSSARTNAFFDYALDSLVLAAQKAANLPWDTPNRLVGWGWLPFFKKCTLGYSFEWRDGFPYQLVNEDQVAVAEPDSQRFPDYFTLAAAIERRFRLAGVHLALRVTAENVTARENPNAVNNNISSPQFLTFSGMGHRTFTGRIRFLGRTKGKNQSSSTKTSQVPPQSPP